MGNGGAGLLGAVLIVTAVLAGAGARAWADGALAIGSTGDVVRDGIAFGMVVNEPKDKAADKAMKHCRTFKARAAAERCRVVATFSGECFAVAYDPQPGTPGAGWGIGPDQLTANLEAIAMCEETAGSGRKGFCQVESGGCDTSPQARTTPQDTDKAAPPPAATRTPRETREFERPPAWLETPGKEERSQFDLGPLLLLLVGAIVGGAYVLNRSLKGKGKADPSVDKSSKGTAPKGKASKGGTKRGRR